MTDAMQTLFTTWSTTEATHATELILSANPTPAYLSQLFYQLVKLRLQAVMQQSFNYKNQQRWWLPSFFIQKSSVSLGDDVILFAVAECVTAFGMHSESTWEQQHAA